MATLQTPPAGHAPAVSETQPGSLALQSAWVVQAKLHVPPHVLPEAKHPALLIEIRVLERPADSPPSQVSPQVGNGAAPHGTSARQMPSAIGPFALKRRSPES